MKAYINRVGLVLMKEDSTYITLPLRDGVCNLDSVPSERFMNMVHFAEMQGLVTVTYGAGITITPAVTTERLAA